MSSAPLLASVALTLLTACRQPEMQRCVDEQNRVVPDSFCSAPGQSQNLNGHPGGGFGLIPMYRFYYGGAGGYGIGSTVSGGGYTALSGRSYATSRTSATSRGGFGGTHGGGGEGGGGGE